MAQVTKISTLKDRWEKFLDGTRPVGLSQSQLNIFEGMFFGGCAVMLDLVAEAADDPFFDLELTLMRLQQEIVHQMRPPVAEGSSKT